MSPTVLQSDPYRFFFFSSDRGEPPHIHVVRERKAAKFWQEHQAELLTAWHDYFKSGN